MRTFIIVFFLVFLFSCEETVVEPVSMREDVTILASDSLLGREAGTDGELLAAEYLAKRFEDLGLLPKGNEGYYQKFSFKKSTNPHERDALVDSISEGMAQAMKATGDKPPLKKSTITKAHDIAKSIKKDEMKEEKIECPKCEGKGCEHCDMKGYHIKEAKVDELTSAQKKLPPALQKAIKKKEDAKEEVEETHTYHKDKQNQKQKDAKGEKDVVDPEPKIKKPSMNEQTAKQQSLMKAVYDVWTNSATELEEVKKNAKYMKSSKDDVSTEVDAEQEKKEQDEKEKSLKIKLAKEKDTDALEKQLTAAQGKINVLQQKLENEKNRAVKPEPNPETGEVPLTVGVAYKHLKDKMKKESEEQKKNKTMTDKPKTPVDTKPSVDYKH